MHYKYTTFMYYKYKISHLDDLETNFSTDFQSDFNTKYTYL
jgi:hypothetical protein